MAILNKLNISTSDPDADALSTFTTGDLIINLGKLTTTGDLADGIFAFADDVSITNFGRIQTSGLAATGISVFGNNARLTNFAPISTTGNDTPDATSDAIIVFGDAFQIANFGNIHVEGDFASAIVAIGNGGSIFNAARIDSSSLETIVVGIVGDDGLVVNRGQINVSGSDSSALLSRGEHSSLVNWGGIKLTGEFDEALTLQRANSEAHNHGVIQVDAQQAYGIIARGDGHTVSNDGSIAVHGNDSIAMVVSGGRFSAEGEGINLHLMNSGQVTVDGTASFGLAIGPSVPDNLPLSASGGLVDNAGSVKAVGDGSAAVVVIGDDHQLFNSGTITANGGAATSELLGLVRAAGVLVSGDNVSIENERTGEIRSNHAGSAAIELNVIDRDGVVNAQLSSVVHNKGLIKGVDVAISGGDGSETIINHGKIIGSVSLGDGDDTFVFGKGGSVSGGVSLGGGDDFVVVENGSGTTRIADFVAGVASGDVIDVSEFYTSFGTLMDHSKQLGADVFIALDNNDSLLLKNLQLNALNAGDFLFL